MLFKGTFIGLILIHINTEFNDFVAIERDQRRERSF